MAAAADSKSAVLRGVRVQLPLSAQFCGAARMIQERQRVRQVDLHRGGGEEGVAAKGELIIRFDRPRR